MKPLDQAFFKMDLAEAMYLDFFNNYLTVEKFAEHKQMTVEEAVALLDFGKNINHARPSKKETMSESSAHPFQELISNMRSALDKYESTVLKNGYNGSTQKILDTLVSEKLDPAINEIKESIENKIRNEVEKAFEDFKPSTDAIAEAINNGDYNHLIQKKVKDWILDSYEMDDLLQEKVKGYFKHNDVIQDHVSEETVTNAFIEIIARKLRH